MYLEFLNLSSFLSLSVILSGSITHQKNNKVIPPPPARFTPLEVGGPGKEEACDYAKNRLEVFASEDISKLQNGTVFLGDSITERYELENYYPSMKVINRGIGGDTMGARIPYGVYDRLSSTVYNLNPNKLILMIGGNDLIWIKSDSLELKLEQYAYLVWTLKTNLPETEFYLVSTLPAKGEYAFANEEMVRFNQNIEKTAEIYGAAYINAAPSFKNEKGELRADLALDDIHLKPAGYDLLTKIYMKEIFQR